MCLSIYITLVSIKQLISHIYISKVQIKTISMWVLIIFGGHFAVGIALLVVAGKLIMISNPAS